jgi:EAL domain-containing protein (putative c-di-GMP-specific phosphodiesterase class I)/glycosyltransferase involved in cell wall biosynthesis/ActR/RegA family two-component response regulator
MLAHNLFHPLQKFQSLFSFWLSVLSSEGSSEGTNDIMFRLKLVTQFYPPDFAATGQFMEELAQNLTQQGIDVHVFTAQPGYAFEQENAPDREWMGKVWVERSNFLRGTSRQWAGRTISSLAFCLHAIVHLCRRENQGDVLLLTSEPPFLQMVGLLMHWLFKVRFVTLIYDLYPEVAIELNVLPENHWLIRIWNWINQQVWQAAEAIVVPCETMRDRILQHSPGLAKKITVIHNWADPTWITPIPKAANPFAQEHQLVDKFVVLYSGNMGRCHDMDTILEAAELLADNPVEFLFVGGGPKREAVIERVQSLKLKNCHFLSYQDKSALPFSLTACDLSIVSVDVDMEGLVAPSKFYSALCAGRPIVAICEPHSYLRSLISQANCGVAIQNGDSQGLAEFIQYLLQNQDMIHQMGVSGHRYIQEFFTPIQISQQYFQLLNQIVNQHSDFYQALEQGDLKILYQPIVNLGGHAIWGLEAKVQWQHPIRGEISSTELNTVIAQVNLESSLNWWFLSEVFCQIQSWQIDGVAQNLKFSIPLSQCAFNHPDLISQLDTLLDLYQIDPSLLQIEIEDRSANIDVAATTSTILQLQARHIGICISKIDSNFLSMDYLHRFTISALKISPSLTNRLDIDPGVVGLFRTMITISHDLNIDLIAQNVDSSTALQRLREIGTRYAQGSEFSPAISALEISLLLLTRKNHGATSSLISFSEASSVESLDTPLVLIADDDRSIRSILKKILHKSGCRVIEAENGAIALEIFRTKQPDLVLLDAQMPEMDGLRCCRSMQSLQEPNGCITIALKSVPILMITALDDAISINAAFEAGATDYITKPVNWQILQQKINRLLS